MRKKTLESEPIGSEAKRSSMIERMPAKRLIASMGVTAVIAAGAGVYNGKEQFLDNVRGYINPDGDQTMSSTGGKLGVEEVITHLDEDCGDVVFTTRVEDASAETTWKDLGITKNRKVQFRGAVITRYCQKDAQVRTVVDHVNKTYDMYLTSDDMYLTTEVDFSKADPENNENSDFFVKYSGSGTTVPEGILDAVIEGTGLDKYTLPNAMGIVMDKKDSLLLEGALWQAEKDTAEKCGPAVSEAIEDEYRDSLASKRKEIIMSYDQTFSEYDVRAFIGSQSPDNPDATVEYTYLYNPEGDIFKLELGNQTKVSAGEVGQCIATEDVKIHKGGNNA